jgi:hypothetical protein
VSTPVLTYTAPPTISRFMLSNQQVRLLLGPYGSGKTTGCIMELAKRMLEEYPDATGVRRTRFVIVRNTAQQLRQTILEDIRKWLGPVMQYKVTDSTVTFEFTHPTAGKIKSDWMMIPLDKPSGSCRSTSRPRGFPSTAKSPSRWSRRSSVVLVDSCHSASPRTRGAESSVNPTRRTRTANGT